MNEQHLGTLLKKLREQQGLTQNELYGGLISEATIYRLEKNKQLPNLSLLKRILHRLKISLSEFELLYTKDEDIIYMDLIEEFVGLGNTADTEKLTNLQVKIAKQNFKENSAFLTQFFNLITALYIYQTTQSFEKGSAIALPIWEYTQAKEKWIFVDILLIANAFFLFDDPLSTKVFHRLIKELQPYQKLSWAQNFKITIPLNYCSYLKRKGRLTETEPYLKQIIEAIQSQPRKDMLYYLEWKYRQAELLYFRGQEEEAGLYVQSILDTLTNTEEHLFKADIEKDWEQFISSDVFKCH